MLIRIELDLFKFIFFPDSLPLHFKVVLTGVLSQSQVAIRNIEYFQCLIFLQHLSQLKTTLVRYRVVVHLENLQSLVLLKELEERVGAFVSNLVQRHIQVHQRSVLVRKKGPEKHYAFVNYIAFFQDYRVQDVSWVI